MIKPLLLAFQFLTVVPVRVRGEITEDDVAGSASFFPFVGAFQGIVTAACALAAIPTFHKGILDTYTTIANCNSTYRYCIYPNP